MSQPFPKMLHKERDHIFWRFCLDVKLGDVEQEIEYEIQLGRSNVWQGPFKFWVPGEEETMRLIFYSCNGYSLNVNKDEFSGPALWKDVMRSEEIPKIPSDTITKFHYLSSREKAIPCHDWWRRSGLL